MQLAVEKILNENGIGYRLIKLTERAYTVNDVINFSNGDVVSQEIRKTIILKGKKTGKKLAVLLRGDDRIKFSSAKKEFGEEMEILNPEQVEEVGGAEPGAVCPFLLKIPLFVDRKVLELEKINCGSGNHLFGLEFKTEDLSRGINYKSIDISI